MPSCMCCDVLCSASLHCVTQVEEAVMRVTDGNGDVATGLEDENGGRATEQC